MDANTLSMMAGVLLSLVFRYVPKLKDWYKAQDSGEQELIMIGLIVLVGLATFGLSCLGWLAQVAPQYVIVCTQEGFWGLVRMILLAAVANQSAYLLTKPGKPVVEG